MKILIVGFPRSGTSLTYRIFENHPDVKQMFFEKQIIKKIKTKEELLKKHPVFNFTCGEKVICEKRVIGKIGLSKETIVDYCLKWNGWFGEEAKIVQIIRYPLDSLNSLVISKKRFPRGPKFSTVYQEYLDYIPGFMIEISKIHNCKTIKYEDLLSRPTQTIESLYKHCNLDSSFKFKEEIKKERAFKYLKNKNLLFEYDDRLKVIIKTLNEIDGAEYPIV